MNFCNCSCIPFVVKIWQQNMRTFLCCFAHLRLHLLNIYQSENDFEPKLLTKMKHIFCLVNGSVSMTVSAALLAFIIEQSEVLILLPQHWSPQSRTFAPLTTDTLSVLFKALVFNFSTPTFKSNSTSFIHLYLGLPLFLLPPVLSSINLFTVLSPTFLTTFPSHSNVHTLITVTISGDLSSFL